MITYDKKLGIYYSTLINDTHFLSGFGTKKIDFSTLFPPDKVVIRPKQIHSDAIVFVDNNYSNLECDALITQQNNTFLTVKTADCVPIIFIDKKKNIIGISHQGWRGTLDRLAQNMIKKFQEQGSDLNDIVVAIGPSIGACCYDIDEERFVFFKKEFPHYPSFWQSRRESGASRISKKFLNLSYLNYLQLNEVGLTKKKIDFFPFCVTCNEKKFYSYRRQHADLSAEMINFAVIKSKVQSELTPRVDLL